MMELIASLQPLANVVGGFSLPAVVVALYKMDRRIYRRELLSSALSRAPFCPPL